ncbi:MAG: protein-glutamate O-methyltransferase CheR [Deltaproteobacteria bacterium]|nr:protein-glutamate O-methyltransferase CheR [Deltaproteobacteria bacterium]
MSGLWSDQTYGSLAKELYRRCGLVFEGGQAHLFRRRLERRAAELSYPSVQEYASAVARSGEAEFDFLVELLTVNETYFFREEDHFHALVETLWPEWVKEGAGPIRVWSAAASTGCEVYTLAILLREKGLVGPGRVEVELLGSDVNSRVLEEARKGVYSEFSMRALSPYFRAKYFAAEGPRFRLDPSVREMVAFRKLNLVDAASSWPVERFHAIFCRNVLIYFDLAAKRKVVGAMTRALRPGGVLIVGRSESLFNVSEAPPLVNLGGTLLHRKTK